jgi:hypothetical protein
VAPEVRRDAERAMGATSSSGAAADKPHRPFAEARGFTTDQLLRNQRFKVCGRCGVAANANDCLVSCSKSFWLPINPGLGVIAAPAFGPACPACRCLKHCACWASLNHRGAAGRRGGTARPRGAGRHADLWTDAWNVSVRWFGSCIFCREGKYAQHSTAGAPRRMWVGGGA